MKDDWFPIVSAILFFCVTLLEKISPGSSLNDLACGGAYFHCLIFSPLFYGFFSISFVSILCLFFSACRPRWTSEALFSDIRNKTHSFLFVLFSLSFASSLYLSYIMIVQKSIDERLLSGIGERDTFFSGWFTCILYTVYLALGIQ